MVRVRSQGPQPEWHTKPRLIKRHRRHSQKPGLRDNRVAVILLTETPHDLDLSTRVQGGGGWDGLVVAEKGKAICGGFAGRA
jgi:hypothetical protein